MANDEHLAVLRQGVKVWNAWRDENPHVLPDLNNADLRPASFGIDLTNANLSGAILWLADLGAAKLIGANLSGAILTSAKLMGTDLTNADLSGASLGGAKLIGATLTNADLSSAHLWSANLGAAILISASLTNADLNGAYLHNADLTNADLTNANLSGANLIDAVLDGACLTGAKLWEIQRSAWSIRGVICKRAFWDREAQTPQKYEAGGFERAYAEKPRIVLNYPDGMELVDFAMLPLIVERLQTQHPDCALHIRSVEDDGHGAKVVITVDDLRNRDSNLLRQEIEQLKSELRYAQSRRDDLKEVLLPMLQANTTLHTIIKELIAMPKQTIHITGGQVGQVGYKAKQKVGSFTYTENDLTQIKQLVNNMLAQQTKWEKGHGAKIKITLDAIQAQLNARDPNHGTIRQSLRSIRSILESAAGNAVYIGWLQALVGIAPK